MLVLTKCTQGDSMACLEPRHFTQQHRQDIIQRIIDAETGIYANEITLFDLHSRNVILLGNNQAHTSAHRPKESRLQSQTRYVVLVDSENVSLDHHSPVHLELFVRAILHGGDQDLRAAKTV